MEQFLTEKVNNFVLYFAPILKRASNKKYMAEIAEHLSSLIQHPLLVTLLGHTINKAHSSIDAYVDGETAALGLTLEQQERDKLMAYYRMFIDVAAKMEAERKPPPADIQQIVVEDL